jgi:hypothetical protein
MDMSNSPHPCSWILKGACLRPASYDCINIVLFLVGISQVKSEWGRRTLVGTLAEGLVQAVGDLLETGGR